jgi:LppX/LprAFG-like lipoprotein
VRATLALVPLALVLGACGGSSTSVDPVAKAATKTTDDGSAHVKFTATSIANGLRVAITGSGDYASSPQRAQVNVAFRSPLSNGTIRELMQGSTIYMVSPLFKSSIPAGKAWVKIDLTKAGRGSGFDFTSFSAATPRQALELLQHARKPTKVGTETIDGVETTHYRATIDADKVPEDKLLGGAQVTYQPVDVWVDGSNHVRRLRLAYSAGAAGASDMTMTFSQYGKPLTIALPDKSVIWDATSVASATSTGKGASG